jgi:hypothetical protein
MARSKQHSASRARLICQRNQQRALGVIGVTFFVLAAYIVADAAYTLIAVRRPDSCVVGVAVIATALVAGRSRRRARCRGRFLAGPHALRRACLTARRKPQHRQPNRRIRARRVQRARRARHHRHRSGRADLRRRGDRIRTILRAQARQLPWYPRNAGALRAVYARCSARARRIRSVLLEEVCRAAVCD